MKSMTGYGRGKASKQGLQCVVEAGSVNRKHSEVHFNLPKELEMLDSALREEVHRYIGRGRVNLRITLEATRGSLTKARINHDLARAYMRDMTQLQQTLRLSDPVTLDQILRAPGVMEPSPALEDIESFWPTVQRAVQQAMRALVQMRRQEGRHLADELRSRVESMRQSLERVRAQAPKVTERYRQHLQSRIQNAGLDLTPEDQTRLDREIVLFADRSDISEETTRLASHFNQFDRYVKSKEPIGRTLDFLAQEIHREINTIGAKANDSAISQEVVLLKTELEKFREQVQNVE